MKKIMGAALSCLMLLNPAFDVAYAANTETKNVNHNSQETRNKILKYGALAVGCLAAIGGLAYVGYNHFSYIEHPLIFDFDSKSVDFNSRDQKIKQMISKYQKAERRFVVVTQIAESRYIIEYFGLSGDILKVMEVSESELNCLLGELYKVIPDKSGTYSGTEEIFEKIYDFKCKNLKNYLSPLKPFKIAVKPEEIEEQYDLILHSKSSDNYTLTAVFYDSDEALEKFMNEALEYEYNGFPRVKSSENDNEFKCGPIGFSEKIPNDLKKYGMNTCHSSRYNDVVTKLVPIDSRKLKNMSPSEYEEVKKLLELCMSGIIIFDYADPELDEICKDVNTEDCEGILRRNVTMNYVFRLMRSVSWGNFLGCYTYNKSKMTKEQIDDRYSKLKHYMKRLESSFGVNDTWDTENQSTHVEKAFGSVVNVVSVDMLQKESLVKEYIRKHYKINIVN